MVNLSLVCLGLLNVLPTLNSERPDYIYELSKNGKKLNIDELRFLYGIDGLTKSSELDTNPKIIEIKSKRDPYYDLSLVYHCLKGEIGLNPKDLEKGTVKYYIGQIVITSSVKESNYKKLKYIRDDLVVSYTLNKNFFPNLEEIGGSLYYKGTESECFPNLKRVREDVICPFITNAKGFEYLESIGGSAYFDSLLTDECFKDLNRMGNSDKECHFVFKNLIKTTNLKHVKFLGNDKSTSIFNKSIEYDIKNLILPGNVTITSTSNIISKNIELLYLSLINKFERKMKTVKKSPYNTSDITKKR